MQFFSAYVSDTILTDMAKKLFIIFLVAFIIRILLVNVAFHGDLNNNISWGNMALSGLNGFFEKKGFQYSIPNQPPLYILLFAFTSYLYKSISSLTWFLNNNVGVFPSSFIWFWQQYGMIYLVKLPSIFADLGIGFVIYKFFENKNKSLGLRLSVLWLFNPITFYNSAIWGQTDPIVNLLGLISIYFLFQKKLVKTLLFLTLSLLFKGSLAIFVPILFFYAVWQKYSLNIWIKGILVSGLAVILISVWFHPSFDLPIWLVNLYLRQVLPGEIGDLSANAFNFWYLVNPGKVLDSIKYFGVAAHTWGEIISLSLLSFFVFKLNKNRNKRTFFYALSLTALTTFLFMTRIHERYLYPFFPVATILVGLIPEFMIFYIILSLTFLLNMYNLFWAPGIPILESTLKTTQLSNVLSIVNLLVFLVLFIRFLRTRGEIKV